MFVTVPLPLARLPAGSALPDIVVILLLVTLLILKDLFRARPGEPAQRFNRALNAGVAPLGLIFIGIAVSRVLG